MRLIQQQGLAALNRAGYGQYEVSAFAQDGHQCGHNMNYWQFGDYLGIGAGAHGKVTHCDPWQVHRRWRQRNPADYMAMALQDKAMAGERRLNDSDRAVEFLMNALRLKEGFLEALFVQRTGLSEGYLQDMLAQSVARGLLDSAGGRIKTTDLGARFLDDLLATLL